MLGLAYNLFPTAGEGAMPAPAADIVEPMVDWTGLYVGVNGGAGAFVDDDPFGNSSGASMGGEGVLGGLMAGYNLQVADRFVLGVQGDIGLADMKRDSTIDAPIEFDTKLKWYASASLRAGWLVSPETMLYAIGGYSYAQFDAKGRIEVPQVETISDSDKTDFDGYHAGVGIESMLTENLTARVEYRYSEYGRETLVTPAGEALLEPTTHAGTIGIAWLFDTL